MGIGAMVFAKKSFGQHFLHDQQVIAKIIAAAEPERFSHVVEVGPGTGALTEHLAPHAMRLTLIEADRDLIAPLAERFPKAEIIQADAAKMDWTAIDGEWVMVANLPYNAANAILMGALSSPNPPARMVVMVQKEVGERLLGQAPSVLTVAVGMYAEVEKVCIVKPGAFNPPPKVDSMVLRLSPFRRGSGRGSSDPESVIKLAKIGFANRRKYLAKNLANAGIPNVAAWLERRGYSPKARAEELTLKDWIDLHTEAVGA